MKNSKSTLLVVDDTATNIDILVELLGKKYDLVVAINGSGALEAVEENKIDLILLDIMMPVMDGYEVCERLKQQDSTKNIPIIFITAKDDEDSISKAYEQGCIDYITKPFKPLELLARIESQLKIQELIEHLNYISSYDQMSGIYNRRKFFELSQKIFLQSDPTLYAVMIDIDNFKMINDTFGHYEGDRVIQLSAESISKDLQQDAIFGRVGGEEFAILCFFESEKESIDAMNKIRKNIENLNTISANGDIIKFTISIGVSNIDQNPNLDGLIKKADKALYEAKRAGRNRVIFNR